MSKKPNKYLPVFENLFTELGITDDDLEREREYWQAAEKPTSSEHEKLSSLEGLELDAEALNNLDISEPNGALLYKGRAVLIYIRDQYIDGHKYKKGILQPFHICNCQGLKDAKGNNRYESRYVLTYDTSSIFKVNINVRDKYQGRVKTKAVEKDVLRKLPVCQSCLYELNWHGFRKYAGNGVDWWLGGDAKARRKIVEEFNIKEFLEKARKDKIVTFKAKDTDDLGTAESTIKKEYKLTPEIKKNLKAERNNCCDSCGRQFNPKQLEIHHRNHNEGDNRRYNLMVLCQDCHDEIHGFEGGLRDSRNKVEIKPLEYASSNKHLADMYSMGLGVEQDMKKAGKYYTKAIEAYENTEDSCEDEAKANLMLGEMYRKGLGVKIDEVKAKQYYDTAIRCLGETFNKGINKAEACYEMYCLYKQGVGIKKDENKAEVMRERAYKEYLKKKDKLSIDDFIKVSEVAPTEEEKAIWKKKAVFAYHIGASHGDANSIFNLAEIYQELQNDEVDIMDADECYASVEDIFADIIKKYEKYAINKFNNMKKGDVIKLGKYLQNGNEPEPIEWQVLDVDREKALVISRYALDSKMYHETKMEIISWEKCTLREWLNNEFYNRAFSDDDKGFIIKSLISDDKNTVYRTPPGNDTNDKVFLLSINEANKYFLSNEDRTCQTTKYTKKLNVQWWLRSPGFNASHATYVHLNGSVDFKGTYYISERGGIRPALWIKIR